MGGTPEFNEAVKMIVKVNGLDDLDKCLILWQKKNNTLWVECIDAMGERNGASIVGGKIRNQMNPVERIIIEHDFIIAWKKRNEVVRVKICNNSGAKGRDRRNNKHRYKKW